MNKMKMILFIAFTSISLVCNAQSAYSVKNAEASPSPVLDKMFIINEDNSHFYGTRKPEQMTLENLIALVDQYAGTKVTHLFFNPNASRASFQSRSRDAIWEPGSGSDWAKKAKRIHDLGLDPYKIWIDRCREKKISPWISMRMNDLHGAGREDDFQNSTFWRTHPQFWRVPNDKIADRTNLTALPNDYNPEVGGFQYYSARALNHAHPEVREYQFAFINELFERYDFDGFEVDWMRFPHHLTPGKEREESVILDEFMRNVRKIADKWEKKRGHKIYIAARIPGDPDNALALGMDAVQWAKEGSVNLLIPSSFFLSTDFDIPIERWRERLDADKTSQSVAVAPGCEWFIRAYLGGKAVPNDLATLYGFVAAERFRGAKNIYLFNWMDIGTTPLQPDDYRILLEKGLGDDVVLHSRRRYPVSYRDVGTGKLANIQLPKQTNKKSSFTIQMGRKPTTGKLWLIVGLEPGDSVQEAVLSATLNGKKIEPATDTKLKGISPEVGRALRFDCPLDTAQDGINIVAVHQESGATQKIVWVELQVEP
jgi:hypothetical protein